MFTIITFSFLSQGIETILKPLGIATKRYAYDQARVRWELEPWVVGAALARLGKRRLTSEAQQEGWVNTRIPHKVQWPEWRTMRG